MSDSKSRGKNWKSKKTKQDWLERILSSKKIDERTVKIACSIKNNVMIVVYALILTFTFKTFFYDNFKITEESYHGVSMFVPQDPRRGRYAKLNEDIKRLTWWNAVYEGSKWDE